MAVEELSSDFLCTCTISLTNSDFDSDYFQRATNEITAERDGAKEWKKN